MNKTIKESAERVLRVAERLKNKDDNYANKLIVIAQELKQLDPNLYNNMDQNQMNPIIDEFDPSQEVMDVEPFTNEGPINATVQTQDGDKIPIESFVQMPQEPVANDYETHTCTVLFLAPKGIKESDIMNYIFGIGKELNVKVKKFEWEELDTDTKNKK
jgi:hypothetical protein